MQDDPWLDRRYYGGDLPAAAERALHEAALAWAEPALAEHHIGRALALAPGHLASHIGAYKFHLYNQRFAEALPHAEACLAEAQRQNGFPADWRQIRYDPVVFGEWEALPRLFLFALLAVGYVQARQGLTEAARSPLEKVAELDPKDRLGARRLLAVLEAGPASE
jgi:tetratricopeptide (TPR) repeat protein